MVQVFVLEACTVRVDIPVNHTKDFMEHEVDHHFTSHAQQHRKHVTLALPLTTSAVIRASDL